MIELINYKTEEEAMGRPRGMSSAVVCGSVLLCVLPAVGAAGECPELVVTFDLGVTSYWFGEADLVVSEQYAYLTNNADGSLTVFDLASPADPVVVFSGSLPGYQGEAWDFEVSNGIASYLSKGWSPNCWEDGPIHLVVVDVRNPTEPVLLADLPFGTYSSFCNLVVEFSPGSLVLSGDRLYILGLYTTGLYSGQWWIRFFDVSDPSSPVGMGSYEYPFPVGAMDMMAASDEYLYIFGESTLITLDSSNLYQPVEIGRLEFSEAIGSLVYSEGYLYLSTTSALRVIDVSSPSEPQEVGSVQGGVGVPVAENRFVYGSTGNNLEVIDATYPWSPVSVGHWVWQEPDLYVWDLELSGKWLYTLESTIDPGSPTYLSVFDTASCRPPYYRYPIAPPQVE